MTNKDKLKADAGAFGMMIVDIQVGIIDYMKMSDLADHPDECRAVFTMLDTMLKMALTCAEMVGREEPEK